jgi:uncharacterized protein (TIGR00251 family)
MSLSVRITPNARASMISGWGADEKGRPVLLIRLAAPPVDGQANAELIRFLAEVLACPKSDIRLTRGTTSRQKALLVPESARETLRMP